MNVRHRVSPCDTKRKQASNVRKEIPTTMIRHRNDVGFFSFRLSGWSGKLLITSVHDRKKACQRHFTACRMLSEDTIWHLHKRQLGSLCSCHNSPDWTLNYIDRARRSKKKSILETRGYGTKSRHVRVFDPRNSWSLLDRAFRDVTKRENEYS